MKKQTLAAAAIGLVTILGAGGATLAAQADGTATPTPTPGASASAQAGQGMQNGKGERGPRGTEVTGDEATKVTNAVKAKFTDLTVDRVVKENDGTYRVMGTKADGTRVGYDVSADLATITEKAMQQGKGKGGPGNGMGQHTEVTGDEATKVGNAVTAKNPGVTIVSVLKDADGSYDVQATKADGTKTCFEVSADLATITEQAMQQGKGKGGPGNGMGQHTEVTGDEATKVGNAVTAKSPGVTIVSVLKDADGSYDVQATKADGTKVCFEVSTDLSTITERPGR